MRKEFFKDIPNIGSLYLKYVFMDFEGEPLIFLCSDNSYRLYFCLCTEIRYEERWIIAKCSIKDIKLLIADKVSIFDFFAKQEQVILVVMDKNRQENSYIKKFAELDIEDKPDKDLFLECDEQSLQVTTLLDSFNFDKTDSQEITLLSSYSDDTQLLNKEIYISTSFMGNYPKETSTDDKIKKIILLAA